MVTAQAEQLKEVLARLDLQKMVLDQHAAVTESAADGNFTYVNDKFCQLSGYTREELIGKSHSIVNADVHPPEFWEAMYDAVMTGGVWQSEVCNRRKDGSYFWLVQTIAAARDDNGELVGYIDIGADIETNGYTPRWCARAGSSILANSPPPSPTRSAIRWARSRPPRTSSSERSGTVIWAWKRHSIASTTVSLDVTRSLQSCLISHGRNRCT